MWLKAFLLFILSYSLIAFAMCLDNIFWISASPEYADYKKMTNKQKFDYIVKYRIKTVLTNPRDIAAGLTSAGILATVLYILLR